MSRSLWATPTAWAAAAHAPRSSHPSTTAGSSERRVSADGVQSTRARRREESTLSCPVQAIRSAGTAYRAPSAPSSDRSARPAASTRSSTGEAAVRTTSPEAARPSHSSLSAADPWSRRSGTATATCSATGSGQAARPSSSSRSTRSTSPMPRPSWESGTVRPSTPVPPRISQRPGTPPSGSSQEARTASGGQSAARMPRSVSAKRRWSSEKVASIVLPRRHFRGRPSTRSAMMLRWISLVPA